MTLVLPHERFFVIPNVFSTASIAELQAGKEIQAFKFGEFDHPVYGMTSITPEVVQKFADGFNDKVYGQEIPISYEHFGMDSAKGMKAAGWVRGVRIADDGMHWTVAFTEEAAKEIKDGAWKYFSPEYMDIWKDPESGILHTYVMSGGALTNRPFFKGMIPLNFSEVIAEHADWEHSEPGEGTPRVDDPEDADTADAQGVRGPSPTIEPPTEASMEEFLKALREKLGLDAALNEEGILIAASELVAEIQPVRDALDKATTVQTFAEQFPNEFARMQKLEVAERESKAHAFAERYATKRLVEGEGESAKTTGFGFSAVTVGNIEKLHLAFSEGKLTQAEIEAVLESLLNTGLVDYSERGTSVEDEAVSEKTPAAFAEKIAAIVAEDKIPYADAVRVAGERHPELAKVYHETYSHRR